jgi:acyl carrier protein
LFTAGGQLIVTDAIRRLCEGSDCKLENQYGPTESHVVAAYRVEGLSGRGAELPPIGRPVSNARLYVLDAQGSAVPLGVSGELYLGGVALARGYLDRPGLTAERFVPEAYSPEAGQRMYRSGDRARWRADGNVDFLGRLDDQVKVRGYRVEPSEIEEVLSEHESVRHCAVVVRAASAGDQRLVAYVVLKPESTCVVGELQAYLRGRLPEYMVPSAVVALEALPLTPSGKVDRHALPVPPSWSSAEAESYVAPRSPVEVVLAGIWRQVLDVEQIGVYDSFFELGGHSLLATQVMSRIRSTFEVELPLRTFFEAPTVAELAETIESITWAASDFEHHEQVANYEEGVL